VYIRHEHSKAVSKHLDNIFKVFITNHLTISLENWLTSGKLINTGMASLEEVHF
jgi:hypothetical protein